MKKSIIFAATLTLGILISAYVLDIGLFVVKSNSMHPLLKVNSLVFTKREAKYEIGDVVTYATSFDDSFVVTHRITNEKMYGTAKVYFTKGDGNAYEDNVPVSNKEIIGKMIFHLSFVGGIMDYKALGFFIYSPIGYAIGAVLKQIMLLSKHE